MRPYLPLYLQALCITTIILVPLRSKATSATSPHAHDTLKACENIGKKAAPQPTSLPDYRSYIYKTTAERDLYLHVLYPKFSGDKQPKPAVLFFFGGGWLYGDIAQFSQQSQFLAARGFVSVLADYRVLCRDGTDPLNAVSDAASAFNYLASHALDLGINASRIAVAGGSAGGQLALSTAFSEMGTIRPAALVLFNPVLDLTAPQFSKNFPELNKSTLKFISPIFNNLRKYPSILIMHGESDQLVPIEQIRNFCDSFQKTAVLCELHVFKGAGHGFFNPGRGNDMWFYETNHYMDTFLESRLKP